MEYKIIIPIYKPKFNNINKLWHPHPLYKYERETYDATNIPEVILRESRRRKLFFLSTRIRCSIMSLWKTDIKSILPKAIHPNHHCHYSETEFRRNDKEKTRNTIDIAFTYVFSSHGRKKKAKNPIRRELKVD